MIEYVKDNWEAHESSMPRVRFWDRAATALRASGIGLSQTENKAANKLYDVWRKLESEYKTFAEKSQTTGKGKQKAPYFYKEMADLLCNTIFCY